MGFTAKPFKVSEMLRRILFLSRPAFFNALDLNKELDILHSYMEELNRISVYGSTIVFNIPLFNETLNNSTGTYDRSMQLNWAAGEVSCRGVKIQIAAGSINAYTQNYPIPNDSVSPRRERPPTYIVLTADLVKVDYAANQALGGIQSDAPPYTVPTVDVEQYQNVNIIYTSNPAGVNNMLCILATVHPKYKADGSFDGYGFLYNTFKNSTITITNGTDRASSSLQTNGSLFEYFSEKIVSNLGKLLNETQLIRRFHLADLPNPGFSRTNLGFSNLVNYKQLIQSENLRDISNKVHARYHLGIGNVGTSNFGYGQTDVLPGNSLVVGMMMLWPDPGNIPVGWVICDGQNGTFDMRGFIPVGHKNSDDKFGAIGADGGAKTMTLEIKHLAPHDHGIIGTTATNAGGAGLPMSANDTGHEPAGATAPTGGDKNGQPDSKATPFDILPPYRVVCFIMFVGLTTAQLPTIYNAQNPPANIPAVLNGGNFSSPITIGTNATDGGYSTYQPGTISGGAATSIGSGITITNPE